jgi:hypothetical protein
MNGTHVNAIITPPRLGQGLHVGLHDLPRDLFDTIARNVRELTPHVHSITGEVTRTWAGDVQKGNRLRVTVFTNEPPPSGDEGGA